MRKAYLRIAGALNLVTALVHLIVGQIDLINPLNESNLIAQTTGELVAVWHIVSILLFATSYTLLKVGFSKGNLNQYSLLRFIGILYVLIGLPFIVVSFWYSIFAPQWILLIPIGVLTLFGVKSKL